MSFQAVTWAIEQKTGSPSAKATLWSIANYANENWVAYPKHETLAKDSEQSTDSVGKRVGDLIEAGLVRRIKLKRYGRRTHDFLILRPSPFFGAEIDGILPLLPSGCDVMEDRIDAAADCGSVAGDESSPSSPDSPSDAAASCGSAVAAETGAALPQIADDATALVRQQEPVTNQESLTPTPSSVEAGLTKEAQAALTAWIEQFKLTYPGPCNHPQEIAGIAAGLTERQRDQVMQGARGAAEIARRHGNTKGLFGHLRFIRSEPLWAEYAKSAPSRSNAQPPRVWHARGSEDWRARAVLFAIIGREMPEAKPNSAGELGADFLGSLPVAGLMLARFADEIGEVRKNEWAFLHAPDNRLAAQDDVLAVNRDRPKVAAWRERIRECLGINLQPGYTKLPFPRQIRQAGTGNMIETNFGTGLWVPCEWPPAKGGSNRTPQTLATEDDLNVLADEMK